jgi:flagellar hook-basal body complex protein FliE
MAPIEPLPPIQSMPLMQVGFLDGSAERAQAPAPASDAFAGMLGQAVSKLNTKLVEADHMQQMAASGQLEDPTQAIVEVEKADIALQLATQVRNKLVDGWQELSRMSV